ncbi:MAG: hypothetical protein JWO38_1190 [Gemmataceae bacterium]|nr:hypothetical protein [Gemmataceae bacterium]
MRIRPWYVIVCVATISVVLIGLSYAANERAKEILLGLGLNLLSSVVFFVLLELYWERIKLVNGKEVSGFDYLTFSRNIDRSSRVRVLATFIYPLTDRPDYAAERLALVKALEDAARRPSFVAAQLLFLHPASLAAQLRAGERKDDTIIRRMEEGLATLRALGRRLEGGPAAGRIEVRLFSRSPPFALFQTDNFASLSFYYRDRPISEVTRYEFFTDAPIGTFVEKTFDDLWTDERTVPLGDCVPDSPPAEDRTGA